ncbi:hypothetical protein [Sulfurospirillum sp. MES]|uniref:hypothetical protein n=1 Tax=Sulfurospirillum sp. MES TaxID=1565314 RepID=UPI000542F930|nr:hypothetical protein [Sulfurospirillum sp. MES]KHG34448.1 MAG: hypothetical protein OA34_04970 [Sulfurospirillum sp. MES]
MKKMIHILVICSIYYSNINAAQKADTDFRFQCFSIIAYMATIAQDAENYDFFQHMNTAAQNIRYDLLKDYSPDDFSRVAMKIHKENNNELIMNKNDKELQRQITLCLPYFKKMGIHVRE